MTGTFKVFLVVDVPLCTGGNWDLGRPSGVALDNLPCAHVPFKGFQLGKEFPAQDHRMASPAACDRICQAAWPRQIGLEHGVDGGRSEEWLVPEKYRGGISSPGDADAGAQRGAHPRMVIVVD
jgi:hypothetical protein